MRLSSYEIILPLIGRDDKEITGKKLLINGLYGALDVVDDAAADHLLKGEPDKLPLSLRERLALRGHITRKDEEGELRDVELLGRIYYETEARIGFGPVILPTYDCNFRCPYCFESHRLSRGREWLSRKMKPEMVEAAFSAIKKLKDKGRMIEGCSLYGGEPFLRENMDLVREICTHAKETGLSLDAITNGYDLDHYIDLLKEFGFGTLQVTVDGVGEYNDSRRLHRDGVPTYEKIMENVTLALKNGIGIKLRVNVNGGNIGGIRLLIEDIRKRGLEDYKNFSYYFKAVSEDMDSPTRITEQAIMDEMLRAGLTPFEAIERQSQYSMHYAPLMRAMKKDGFPGFATAFCGTEKGMAAIAPDGKIYPCWDIVAMDEEAVGQIDVASGSLVYYFNKAKWKLRTSDRMKACRICPYITICRGGCVAEAKREHGSYFREACGEVKELFAFVASRVAGRKWEETGEEELTVSMYGPVSRLTDPERQRLMESKDPNEILRLLKEADFLQSNNQAVQ